MDLVFSPKSHFARYLEIVSRLVNNLRFNIQHLINVLLKDYLLSLGLNDRHEVNEDEQDIGIKLTDKVNRK